MADSYDWRVQVRVVGCRDGWDRTLVDTPIFELRSNAQFGGIWADPQTAAQVAAQMFSGLTAPGDQTYVTVTAIDGSFTHSEVFAA
ncbi:MULTISPECIES: hypothetical protein [Mycolicibacter]|uniref:Uncharacterized protein n=1 Tax=Mycolicibacter longobardus TaxID=1108812 RepID=A0A1X1YBG3_9MYCO|nr:MULTISPECIES: hypothetical protein [Mycolicibacter]ORW08448.1 hypothetical protein AWC16_18785 [Mycolicibacter longobardus]RAV04441.1 hypothetical protein DQP56_01080 [Mycolicibacter senuensis]